ncbi:hypothetical protein pb186bvf_017214 [Paramecium bursaria]
MKCFRFSGDINLENQCKAFHIATSTQQELNTITAKFKSKSTFPKVEQDKITSEYKRIQIKSMEDFRFAASVFQQINCHIQAAQCFFSGQMYEQATKEYLIDNQYLGAADSSFEGKLYQLAGILYLKSNYFEKSILAFEKVQDYFVILLILNHNKTYYISDEFQFKLHKYIPLFLEQVFDRYYNHRFETDFNQILQYLANKRNELQNEFELIEIIRYPQNEDELIDCIWHCLKLNPHFIIKKLEISIINYECQMAQMLFETNYIDEFTINHKYLITDVIGYYGLYDLLEFLNLTFQLISQETQRNTFYQTVFKYSQYIECNTRQKISGSIDKNFGQYYKKFIQSQDSREQKQYFGILYLFGFQEQMNNFLNELTEIRLKEYQELNELVQFRTFKFIQLTIEQIIPRIEQCMINWNQQNCVQGFYQIIFTIFELFKNKDEKQESFLRKINNHEFQQIVLFLSFTANILKYNKYLNVQLQLFEALCVYFNLVMPNNKCMQFISQSYIIISKKSQLFSEQIEIESQNIGEKIYLAPTNLIVKQIRKIFQSLIKDAIKIFFKDELNKIQVEQRLYQQFFQTKHKKYFYDQGRFQNISKFQVSFIFYLEKAFRLKFDQNLESIKLDNNFYLEDRFLNLISHQYLIKAILNIDYDRKMERIIKGLQLCSYQQADIELDNFFKTFLYLNESLNEKFTNQDIDDIENYMIALKYGKQPYFDFNYLYYLLLSYQNNNIKTSLKRDFRISFVYILNLVVILQQNKNEDQIIEVTYKVDELLHINLIKKVLNLQKKIEQHGEKCILVRNQLNDQELINIFTNWLKWYFNNFGILGNKYVYLIYENCDLKMRNILIENIEQSQSLSKQEKDKLLIQGKSEKADKIIDYYYLIKYTKINPVQEKLYPKIQRASLEKAYFSTQIYEIRSASTVLASMQFYQQITKINSNIYYDQFNKCYNQIEMMRKKIFIYIFKICNNAIKFRSAMKLLMDLKDFQYDLYYNLEDNYDGDQDQFYNDFDDRGLLKQLQYADKQIIEWQLKNDKFQAQINQLQIQNQNDISNIKLWRKKQLISMVLMLITLSPPDILSVLFYSITQKFTFKAFKHLKLTILYQVQNWCFLPDCAMFQIYFLIQIGVNPDIQF